MSETLFAVIGADGVVQNVIVADQEFIDALPAAFDDPDHDTGDLTADNKYVDVTAVDPRPSAGWTYAKKKFTAPVPTQEELDAQAASTAAAELRAEDDAFLDTVQTKLRGKKSLTQDERDRMLAIDLSRR